MCREKQKWLSSAGTVSLDLLLCVDFKMTATVWVGAVVWKAVRTDLHRVAMLRGI